MAETKKPRKKDFSEYDKCELDYCLGYDTGYNFACDDWKKWVKAKEKELGITL